MELDKLTYDERDLVDLAAKLVADEPVLVDKGFLINLRETKNLPLLIRGLKTIIDRLAPVPKTVTFAEALYDMQANPWKVVYNRRGFANYYVWGDNHLLWKPMMSGDQCYNICDVSISTLIYDRWERVKHP